MQRLLLTLIIVVLASPILLLANVNLQGKLTDKNTNRTIIGATIKIKDTKLGAYSGLNGNYSVRNVPTGKQTILVNYVGYEPYSVEVDIPAGADAFKFDVQIAESSVRTQEVAVYASRDLATEEGARQSEKNNISTSTIVSSKLIEVSPDINVSTVIQKMAGVAIEEEGSNEGSYAVIRGMDKRYNNTLINGVKIPSPDGRNRFVPLDIFPADVIDRLEVHKSVTPDMEADAIGGTINLVMKNAPESFMIKANAAVGYNDIFLQRDFLSFNTNVQASRSPGNITAWSEQLGKEERQNVIQTYFPLEASVFRNQTAMPNAIAGLSIGDRFGEKKEFGAILALSYQAITRGQDQLSTNIDPYRETGDASVDNVYVRENSIAENRLAIHNKLDYTFNSNHNISLYNAFLRLEQDEAWYLIDSSYFRQNFVRTVDYELFSQQIDQNIYNSTLRGEHNLGSNFEMDWSLAYSIASRNQPDRATMRLNRKEVNDLNINGDVRVDFDYQYVREWTYNTDQDIAYYLNAKHTSFISDFKLENKVGGLFRYKDRETEYDEYTMRPYLNNSRNEYPGNQEFIYMGDVRNGDIRNTYFRLFNPNGSQGSTNEFEIREIVAAGYYQARLSSELLEITAGARAEYTDLAFQTAAYRGPQSPGNTKGDQQYLNVLPGVFLKYKPVNKINLRGSYNRALARPSFYEFVPAFELNSDGERFTGNPNLRNTISDNLDFRFEYFPSAMDKLFVGFFYKNLNDPIERSNVGGSSFSFVNFDKATNYGLEMEFTKYFNQFGLRMNYSYTQSDIASEKTFFFRLTEDNLDLIDQDVSGRLRADLDAGRVNLGDLTNIRRIQNRPLQGQTDHLFNISLLYKNIDLGWDAQVDLNYIGERIAFVSNEYELDWWQRPQINLDFSTEYSFGDLTLYVKARNLLDTPREFYVKRPLTELQRGVASNFMPSPWNEELDERTFARRNTFGRNIQIGFKYLFN